MAPPSSTRGTLAHFIASRWRDLNKRTVNGSCARPQDQHLASYFRDGVRLEMNRQEFATWCGEHWHEAEALYRRGMTPSLDRIRTTDHYHIRNIRILERGENSSLARQPQRRLTVVDAEDIRARLRLGGVRQVDLATEYGVSQVAISLIKRGLTYANKR